MGKSKTFVRGSARLKVFDNGGEVINVSININDLMAYANDKGYVPFVIAQRTEVDEWDNTHYMYIDEYTLQRQKERQETASAEGPTAAPSRLDDKTPAPEIGKDRDNPFR